MTELLAAHADLQPSSAPPSLREDPPWAPQEVPRSVLGRPHTACIYFALDADRGAVSRQQLQQMFGDPQAEPYVHLALSSAEGVATVGHRSRSEAAALAASLREVLHDVGATVIDVRHGP